MKKIGLVVKETLEFQIKNRLGSSSSVFIVNYAQLSSPDISNLRQALKAQRASFFVVKNTVARRALKDSALDSLIKVIEGPCGFVFSTDDPVATSKTLCDFKKDHEPLKLQGGFLEDKILENKDIVALAKLPSKEVLRAQVVMALNSPIVKLAMVLNNSLKKFVICLDKIREKKQTEGGK